MKRFLVLSFFVVLLLPADLLAQKSIPRNTNQLVNDFAGILARNEEVRLTVKLNRYVQETSTQIAIVTENSLQGEDPFDYTYRLAREWGIGGGSYDNGVLIYVALEDREVRIQTGYGAEGFLPDAMSKRIIEQIILPAFRSGRYYEGLDQAVDNIMQLGAGEYEGEGVPSGGNGGNGGGIPSSLIIFLIIILIIILSNYGSGGDDDDGGYHRGGRYNDRRGGWGRGGGWIFLPGPGGWGGGSGGGGGGFGGFDGGGGFGGFGGGDFGGGGAGGSW